MKNNCGDIHNIIVEENYMTRTKALAPDAVLKTYWRNSHRLADLYNQAFFNGEERILPENLTELDTDESGMQLEHRTISAVTKIRDLIKQCDSEVGLFLISLENQMATHFAMPVRSMLMDAWRYTRQCQEIENAHREAKDLNGSDEFLSGMTAEDRIRAVMTLVVYYGEKAWSGPDCLWDMMDIPDMIKPYVNNYDIHVLQARDGDQYDFKNQDNKDFFMLISELYENKGNFRLEDFEKKHPGMRVYWETAAAVGAATGTTKLMNYALKYKGEDLNMCTALQGLIDEGHREGRIEGHRQGVQETRNEDIITMVRVLRSLNIPDKKIALKLHEEYAMTKKEIHKYLN